MEDGKKKLDLELLRSRVSGSTGKEYWKSLEEAADTDEFRQWVDDEFPHRGSLLEIDRRSALKFLGASMALAGMGGCRSLFLDKEKVVPYVTQPEEIVPGKPLFFRTAMPRAGYAMGLEVSSREGRPVKVEGNPDHPASYKGACDSFALASILTLYDPDRSRNVTYESEIETWAGYTKALRESIRKGAKEGKGFRILTETVISPTLKRQLDQVQAMYPDMQWHQWEPLNRDNVYDGARRALGRPLQTIYDLTNADVILSVDADFVVSQMPGSIRYAREMMDKRRVEETHGTMNRVYAVHVTPTLNGAVADHVQPMSLAQIQDLLASLAGEPTSDLSSFNSAVREDLYGAGGRCAIVVGEQMPPQIHALAHLANAKLGAVGETVRYMEPPEAKPENQTDSLKALVQAMDSGEVGTLLIIGSNPAYNAPADIGFAGALAKVRNRFHYGMYVDETAALCNWHAPEAHFLESWSDTRAYDGTVSIVQPLIDPLFEGRTPHELLSHLMAKPQTAYDTVRETWKSQLDDKAWRKAIHDGYVPDSPRAPLKRPPVPTSMPGEIRTMGFEIHFRPDPTIGDGRWSNNGWLQELPKPITKVLWDNVVHVSPATAKRLDLRNEDHVEITVGTKKVVGPTWIVPGHADNCATVFLGYGRLAGGTLSLEDNGKPRGYNAYSIQQSFSPWVSEGTLRKVEGLTPICVTQDHNSMEGRDIVRQGTLRQLADNPNFEPPAVAPKAEDAILYNQTAVWAAENPDLPQWGMSIDLNTCIGCNACVTACQAENNIPVVGKEQVMRGREMHWIRIDRYYGKRKGQDPLSNPATYFQPLTCMHCETAPCEPVCPVGATVHSHEGLNQMVYNRCVGTRYCSNNCPYKVRRFNYLNYQHLQPSYYKDKDIPLLRMLNNPDVTVRSRGVMEKCTYCTQRISAARITAKKENRPIKDGEVVTACQQACPTHSIVFGNIADKTSSVRKLRDNSRKYSVLAELNTVPRTTYLGKIRNTNLTLEPYVAPAGEGEASGGGEGH
ncbi:MAG: TAT-variant-translocated molybdopterin oxidoreductase [Fimbriimonadaceae bacterium]